MKKIALTLRTTNAVGYAETRDCIDQRWIDILLKSGLYPILVPNNRALIEYMLRNISIDGILFTGGNNLAKYGGDSPERDSCETRLLEYVIENKTPVMGVCRGMQLIQDFFGSKLIEVSGHVNRRHALSINETSRLKSILNEIIDVNSYHNWGSRKTVKPLVSSAYSKDNIIMAIEHESLPIFGNMWHPEREKDTPDWQLRLFKKIFSTDF